MPNYSSYWVRVSESPVKSKMNHVVNIIRDEIMPFLLTIQTLNDIKDNILQAEIQQKLLIRKDVWNYFGISWERDTP